MSHLKALNDYRVKVELPVAWSDMDMYRHVNNANFFKYFEAARVRYFDEIGFSGFYDSQGITGVLSSASCRFIIPLVYPDWITVGAKADCLDDDEIQMEHFILSKKKGLAAIGESRIVIFDFHKDKKIAIPEFLKKAIAEFENRGEQ